MHFARQGKQRWMLVLTLGAAAIVFGFIMRIACGYNPYSLGLYVISTLFILLSPCAFLAHDYMCLSRISLYLGREDVTKNCLIFPVNKLVTFYVISDISTFLIQAAGGAMTASGQTNPKMGEIGEKVSMAGLSLQGASFISYTFILLYFGWRVRKLYPEKWNIVASYPDQRAHPPLWKFWDGSPILDWRILYFAVLITCIGFVTRSSFRIAEFSGGYRGHLYITESYFYILDALPIWLAISVYIFVWPPRFLKHPDHFRSIAPPREEMEEVVKET